MENFLKGIVAGFIVAVPLGPVAVLCFQRVLTGRLLVGAATVLGAAAADAFYGLLAALGLGAITELLRVHHRFFHVFGGLLIIGLGIVILRAHTSPGRNGSAARSGPARAFLSAMALMLANPTVIVSLVAVLAALGAGAGHSSLGSVWIAGGVFIGSSSWWIVYRLIALRIGPTPREGTLRSIDRFSGTLICAFGAWELFSALILRR
jgi:threonine/homoserine/homoserine lactone efflux protein